MRKRQKGVTVRAIRVISREVLAKKIYVRNGVLRLDSSGKGFELLKRLPPERRKLAMEKIMEIVWLAPRIGNEDAISVVTSIDSRKKWTVQERRKCEIHDSLLCAISHCK